MTPAPPRSARLAGALARGDPLRADVLAVLEAGLAAVDPAAAVARALPRELSDRSASASFRDTSRALSVCAIGKAAVAMARGAAAVLGPRLSGGLIVTKDGHAAGAPRGLRVLESGHPVPDARSLAAGAAVLAWGRGLPTGELGLVLLSGGASALVEALVPGVALETLRERTEALLRSGTDIAAVNAERKRLSQVKGGGLARVVDGARERLLVLCLSDVPGDDPAVLGSGPAWLGPEGPRHVIVGSVTHAVNAAAAEGARRGFQVITIADRLDGEAREAHGLFLDWLDAAGPGGARRMVIAGGETTVTVRGNGRGGRNQELALAAVSALQSRPGTVLAALGTDGTDGPTDAAGGLVDSSSAARARAAGVDVSRALEENDAYGALQAMGDLIVTGPTGTNVGDLVVLAV